MRFSCSTSLSFVCACYTILACIFMSFLLVYQIILISQNVTSQEFNMATRRRWLTCWLFAKNNVNNSGFLRNWLDFLKGQRKQSYSTWENKFVMAFVYFCSPHVLQLDDVNICIMNFVCERIFLQLFVYVEMEQNSVCRKCSGRGGGWHFSKQSDYLMVWWKICQWECTIVSDLEELDGV